VITVIGIATTRALTPHGEHQSELLDDAIRAPWRVWLTAPRDSNDISLSAKLQR
jgi:hypothetical protein